MRNILGTASHETRPFLELTRNISHKFLRRLKAESLKNCPRSSARQSPAFLGALSNLDEFFLNPQIRTHSRIVPGTFWNTNVENQEPNEDRSQDDPHSELGPSVYQSRDSIDSDPDELLTASFCDIWFNLPWPLTCQTLFDPIQQYRLLVKKWPEREVSIII